MYEGDNVADAVTARFAVMVFFVAAEFAVTKFVVTAEFAVTEFDVTAKLAGMEFVVTEFDITAEFAVTEDAIRFMEFNFVVVEGLFKADIDGDAPSVRDGVGTPNKVVVVAEWDIRCGVVNIVEG